ncbi:MAG: cyclic nucleotide-binding domain-containing protein [Paracoccaceae bacterium]|nr:cyclic nucleotide-binding domain-containing protein [Paracoccaceae bacterium]
MEAILDECHGLPVEAFQPRDRLVAESEPAEAMYVLIEGAVEVVRGGMALLTVSAPGSLIGEMSALLGRPYSATVRAATDVTVYRVEEPGRFLAERPVLLLRTAQLLAQRLDSATAYLADLKTQHEGRGGDQFGVIDDVLGALLTQADRRIGG